MKKTLKTPVLLALLTFVSCWQQPETTTFVRPVELAEVRALGSFRKEFIATLVPVSTTDLAFAVPGTLQSLDIVDGSVVRKGQILARLSADDYLLQVVAERENYLTAKSTLERAERLLERQAVSVQEFQITRAKYQASRARFEYAESQLQKTLLTAPFSGSVQRVYVGDYQEVSAGMTVCKLINPNHLEVRFTLPQTDLALMAADDSYSVSFGPNDTVQYTAKISEVVDASVDGAGIPITLAITDPDFAPQPLNLKAGFACTVRLTTHREDSVGGVVVSLSAIFDNGDNGAPDNGSSGPCVWVYDVDSQVVTRRRVTTHGLMGSQDMIISGGPESGLKDGDMVVTAGVYQLSDNQRVKPLN